MAVTVPAPFERAGAHLRVTLPGGVALFTTRRGGVSTGPFASLNVGVHTGDAPAAVATNLDRARAAAGVGALARSRQVHGSDVRLVRDRGDVQQVDEVDGQATALDGVGCFVVTADCMPIALVTAHAVAMVHAGWRGLAAGVLESGLAALLALGDPDDRVHAAIGPAAGPCCYEVGDEVRTALGEPPVGGPATIDLVAIADDRLRRAGATVARVDLCTLCATDDDGSPLFFSHRRDRGVTGRQAGVAWRS